MRKKIIICLFGLSLFPFGNTALGQDSVLVENRQELDNIVRYYYGYNTEGMNSKLRGQIDSLYKDIDLSGNEYSCDMYFKFLVELDSCGNIIKCESHIDTVGLIELNNFVRKVTSVILNSGWQIPTIAVLPDTTYQFFGCYFRFEINCDSNQISFTNPLKNPFEKEVFFYTVTPLGIISFKRFEFGCQ